MKEIVLAHFQSLFGKGNCVYSEKMKEDVGNGRA